MTDQETENEGWSQGNARQLEPEEAQSVAALRVLAEDWKFHQGAALEQGSFLLLSLCSQLDS